MRNDGFGERVGVRSSLISATTSPASDEPIQIAMPWRAVEERRSAWHKA